MKVTLKVQWRNRISLENVTVVKQNQFLAYICSLKLLILNNIYIYSAKTQAQIFLAHTSNVNSMYRICIHVYMYMDCTTIWPGLMFYRFQLQSKQFILSGNIRFVHVFRSDQSGWQNYGKRVSMCNNPCNALCNLNDFRKPTAYNNKLYLDIYMYTIYSMRHTSHVFLVSESQAVGEHSITVMKTTECI